MIGTMRGDQSLNARFLEEHLAHQKTLMGYLLATVRDFQVAEDLLQKITLILWEQYTEGQKPSSYLAWALGIARHVVMRHFRDRQKREVTLSFDILDRVAPEMERSAGELSAESRALAGCIEKLPPASRDLVRLRYEEGLSLGKLSARLGLTMAAVNMKLVRLRRALLDCTRQAWEEEG
jgi:RNA polymerase sigma-70 factor (ECF subfamily)